jgi:transcriptional regulator with XRE-family HTH domain
MNGSSAGPITREIGQRLRALREGHGWSLDDLERESEGRMTKGRVSSYERGDRSVGLEQLVELAEFWGVTPGDLCPQVAPPAVVPPPPPLVAATFVAITAAKDAEIADLTRDYERQLDELRERLAAQVSAA